MKIRLPITYTTIVDGYVELELLSASEAQELLGVSQFIWTRWHHDGWIPGYHVDRTEMLYDRYQLDTAALVDGPIREYFRNKHEHIEEVTRA
jgi:hypothetical protein